jgi:hypothetical protein
MFLKSPSRSRMVMTAVRSTADSKPTGAAVSTARAAASRAFAVAHTSNARFGGIVECTPTGGEVRISDPFS